MSRSADDNRPDAVRARRAYGDGSQAPRRTMPTVHPMPMTTAQIATLTALIHANRNDHNWDRQGILKHVEALASDPRPFDQLETQAINASANPKATTPAAILWTSTARTADQTDNHNRPADNPPTPWRTRLGLACPEHGGTTWRTNDGEWSCCYFERLLEASDGS